MSTRGVAKSSRHSQCHGIIFLNHNEQIAHDLKCNSKTPISNFSSRKEKVDTPAQTNLCVPQLSKHNRKPPYHPKSIPQSSTNHAPTQRKRNIRITLQQRLPFQPNTATFSLSSPSLPTILCPIPTTPKYPPHLQYSNSYGAGGGGTTK